MQWLAKAIEHCGTQAELARRVSEFKKNPKIRQAHVWNWLNRDHAVPADMVLAVEEATSGQVSRHGLRPDIYPGCGKKR